MGALGEVARSAILSRIDATFIREATITQGKARIGNE